MRNKHSNFHSKDAISKRVKLNNLTQAEVDNMLSDYKNDSSKNSVVRIARQYGVPVDFIVDLASGNRVFYKPVASED